MRNGNIESSKKSANFQQNFKRG
jgi:hypothetical protein